MLTSWILPALSTLVGYVVAVVVLRRFCAPSSSWPWLLGWIFATLVGFAVAGQLAFQVPTSHWQWIPYIGGLACISGVALWFQRLRGWRYLLALGPMLVAAWLLVPQWPDLRDQVTLLTIALTLYFSTVGLLLGRIGQGVAAGEFLSYLTCVALALAVCLTAAVSLTYGQLAVVIASAFAGCTVASWWRNTEPPVILLIPCFAASVGGMAFIGCIELQPPFYRMLLLPLTPAALWIAKGIPDGWWAGKWRVPCRATCFLLVLAMTCAVVLA